MNIKRKERFFRDTIIVSYRYNYYLDYWNREIYHGLFEDYHYGGSLEMKLFFKHDISVGLAIEDLGWLR